MDIVKFGPLSMTRPSFVAFLTAVIVGTFLVFKNQAHIGLMLMLSGFVQAYTINCVMVGHCDAWAWVLASMTILGTVLGLHAIRNKK